MSNMIAHLKRKLNRTDKKGGIEGLPMELMIIIVVAALGTAILVGWMSNIEEPQTIGDVDSSASQFVLSKDTGNFSTTITVRDNNGDPIEGATVVLTGCGVKNASSSNYYSYSYSNTSNSGTSVNGTTNSNGEVTFNNLSVTKTSAGVGYVNVHVSAGDYGENNTLKIPVVR